MAGVEKEIKKTAKKASGGKKGGKSGASPEKKVAQSARRLLK